LLSELINFSVIYVLMIHHDKAQLKTIVYSLIELCSVKIIIPMAFSSSEITGFILIREREHTKRLNESIININKRFSLFFEREIDAI
jgi:uncharacterized protein YfeS